MAELAKSDETKTQLNKKIQDLENHLQDEKDYNAKLFVNEQVSQMCQRAYFSYKLIQAEKTEDPVTQQSPNLGDKETEEKPSLISHHS